MLDVELRRFRRAVDAEATGAEIAGIVDDLRRRRYTIGAAGELKTAPRGYPKDHPRSDLLLRKGMTIWGDHEGGPSVALAPKLIPSTVKLYRKMVPFVDWLNG